MPLLYGFVGLKDVYFRVDLESSQNKKEICSYVWCTAMQQTMC